MSETLQADGQEFTEGRGGLKIPKFEQHILKPKDVLLFFESLYKLNQVEYSMERRHQHGRSYELAVPAGNGKPSALIQGYRRSWTFPAERHRVLVPPEDFAGLPVEVLGYYEDGEAPPPEPGLKSGTFFHGEEIREDMGEQIQEPHPLDYNKRLDSYYSDAAKVALGETVALLT